MNLRLTVTASSSAFLVASPAISNKGEATRKDSKWHVSWNAENAERAPFLKPLSGSVSLIKSPDLYPHYSSLKLKSEPSDYGQLEMGASIHTVDDRVILVFFSVVSGEAPGPNQNRSFLKSFYNQHLISEIVVDPNGIETTAACHASVVMTSDSITAVSCSLSELRRPIRPVEFLYVPMLDKELHVQ